MDTSRVYTYCIYTRKILVTVVSRTSMRSSEQLPRKWFEIEYVDSRAHTGIVVEPSGEA